MEHSEPLESGLASGESTRLGDIYLRHVGRLTSFASLLAPDRNDAQDIVHDCFVRVAARLPSLGDDVRFEAYLQRSVVNACRSAHRRASLERAVLWRERHPDPVSGPDAGRDDELWAAIRDLPYRQRAAVVLRYHEDLSEERTAEILSCSPRAVNALVSRATASLRSRLTQEASP